MVITDEPSSGAFTEGWGPVPGTLKSRIRRAYIHSLGIHSSSLSPLWEMITSKNSVVHESLLDPDNSLNILDDPGRGNLFYGFDNLFKDFTDSIKQDPDARLSVVNSFSQDLVTLAEAFGVQRLFNPEGGSLFPAREKPAHPSIDDLISSLEDRIGVELSFPSPFPDEYGIVSKRGTISQRAIPAIYQAFRIRQLSQQYGAKVVEIGAGLGRTAYYATRFGVTDYTIIDLPMSNVAQAAYLGLTLGEDQIALFGEEGEGRVRIMPPTWLFSNRENFDIFFNADSLTEMSTETMERYVRAFIDRGSVLLSINHEANHDRVAQMPTLQGLQIARHPYLLRKGYVEEVFVSSAYGDVFA